MGFSSASDFLSILLETLHNPFSGLLRRFAPRNDATEESMVFTNAVIASETTKQSGIWVMQGFPKSQGRGRPGVMMGW
ncbi:MAG: hypothetical protein FWF12_08905 [Betaproteobacteria bacterium]|nr:hypothetical protein [Betaproteobacteria bacterium]